MISQFIQFNRQRNKSRRRGVAMVYVVLLIPVLVGITAYCVDTSYLYVRKSKAQTAADAAALGGAWRHANFQANQADAWARWYASLPNNGAYTQGVNGTTVAIEYPALDRSVTPNVTRPNWYRVTITKPEPTFFAGFFGSNFRTVNVKASATALYETLAELNINGGGTYGKAPGPVNLSLFGPDGYYNNGDCYSVKKLPDGSDNPLYNPKGYDFKIDVENFTGSTVYMQIFDPDCYNTSGADVNGVSAIDEYRNSSGGSSGPSDATITKYTLYNDKGTPYNTADDTVIQQTSYGNTSTTDLIWNNFASISKSSLGTSVDPVTGLTRKHNLRMNVVSTAGASENGFDLRVNDKSALSRTSQVAGLDNFTENNGSAITAQGHMPMNFNSNGTTAVELGTIPVQAAGGQLQIRKFDTDVGAKSVTYTCSTLPGQSWAGQLSSNGTFSTDTIQVPKTYTTAGTWTATYSAGMGDTSVWDMSYSNYGPGKPGGIKLVR